MPSLLTHSLWRETMKLAPAQATELIVEIWPFQSPIALLCVPMSGQAVLYTHVGLYPSPPSLASWVEEILSTGIPGAYIWQDISE
jgi:hypothetical protein